MKHRLAQETEAAQSGHRGRMARSANGGDPAGCILKMVSDLFQEPTQVVTARVGLVENRQRIIVSACSPEGRAGIFDNTVIA